MAIQNEILAGRFARGIQRIFSMKGGVPSKQVSGEVMPELFVDDLTALEHRILVGVRSFGYNKFVGGGGAGTFSAIRLRNPVGSGALAIIEKIDFSDTSGAANQFIVRGGPIPTVVDLGTVDSANTAIRDARLGPTSGAMVTSFGTPVVGALGTRIVWGGQVVANGSIAVVASHAAQELTLAPGDAYTAHSNVANVGGSYTIWWRERAVEESELLVVG